MRTLLRSFRHAAVLSTLFIAIPVATAHHDIGPADAMPEPFCEACMGAISFTPATLVTVGFVSSALLLLLAFLGRPHTLR